jgi:hypothetical protein
VFFSFLTERSVAGRHHFDALDELGDPGGDLGPQRARQVVAHAVDHHELGARDGLGGRPPTADVAHQIVGAMEHHGGYVNRSKPRRTVPRPGCSIAIVWAIIPPIEAPTTWAPSSPSASSRPTASAAMSESV